jgi:hypothetical protein
MTVFSGSMEVQEFSMRNDVEPKTKVYGKPLTERERRSIQKQDRRGNIDVDDEKLFRLGLAPNPKGIFIANIWYNGKTMDAVKDRDQAVEILMECHDVTFMNELKMWLIGMSDLNEGEAKNLPTQSKP